MSFMKFVEESRKSFSGWKKELNNKLIGRNFAKAYSDVPELYKLGNKDSIFPPLDRCVIKSTEGYNSRNVFLFNGGKEIRGRSEEEIKRSLNGLCMCEEFIQDEEDIIIPRDYKFYVFKDTIGAILVVDRNLDSYSYYTPSFSSFPFPFRTNRSSGKITPKPKCFDEMSKIAINMGSRIGEFVRVDMYASNRGPVFGEFTFFPHGGKNFTPEADRYLGELWPGKKE